MLSDKLATATVLKKAIRIAFLLPYWRTNRRLRYTGGALLGSETTTDERLEPPWQRFTAGAAPGLADALPEPMQSSLGSGAPSFRQAGGEYDGVDCAGERWCHR